MGCPSDTAQNRVKCTARRLCSFSFRLPSRLRFISHIDSKPNGVLTAIIYIKQLPNLARMRFSKYGTDSSNLNRSSRLLFSLPIRVIQSRTCREFRPHLPPDGLAVVPRLLPIFRARPRTGFARQLHLE